MGGWLKIAKRVASGAEVWTKPDAATTRKLENPPTISNDLPTKTDHRCPFRKSTLKR
jgi:hypothetical protein